LPLQNEFKKKEEIIYMMQLMLQLFLIAAILIYISIIVLLLKKKTIILQYSLVWLGSAIVLAFIAIFPSSVAYFASLIGIEVPVNAVFLVEGMFVLLILISLTSIVSKLSQAQRELIQAIGLLEERVRQLEKKK